jgi:hypothetical protein
MVNFPEIAPLYTGENVTLIVQLAPAFNCDPQVLVSPKFFPAEMLEIARAVLPVLVNVTFWGLLVVPSSCPAKVRLVVDSHTEVFGTTTDTVTVRVTFPLLAMAVTG